MSKSALAFIVLVILIFSGLFLFVNYSKQKTSTIDKNTTATKITATPTQEVTPTSTASGTPTPTPSTTITQTVLAKKATIKTSRGNITVSFYGKDAPNTVANFVKKAQGGFYNNLTFHRVEDWVVQGGDPKGSGEGGGEMPTEINDKPFVVGALGVARRGDIKVSNDAQFFITKTEALWLNGQYTNFGIVTDGMNVINTIKVGDKIISIEIQ